jgi:hypothetical protein
MLQNGWMSPHKPDPIPRKVDVDLSAILIRAEDLSRPGFGYDLEPSSLSSATSENSSSRRRLRWISLPQWANISFALAACFTGIVCTLWTFDDLAHLNRLIYPTADTIYVRPGLRPGNSRQFVSRKPHVPLRIQPIESRVNPISEPADSSNQTPPLSMLSPLFGNNSLPLLSSTGSAAGSSSSRGQSTGPGRSSMSECSGSIPQGRNFPREIGPKQSRLKNPTVSSAKAISAVTTKILSARQTIGLSQSSTQKARMTQTTFNRANLSPHLIKNQTDMLQNRMGPNAMHMQHGMIAQPSLGAGLNVGLNGAGLGGGGGGRHGGPNARR